MRVRAARRERDKGRPDHRPAGPDRLRARPDPAQRHPRQPTTSPRSPATPRRQPPRPPGSCATSPATAKQAARILRNTRATANRPTATTRSSVPTGFRRVPILRQVTGDCPLPARIWRNHAPSPACPPPLKPRSAAPTLPGSGCPAAGSAKRRSRYRANRPPSARPWPR